MAADTSIVKESVKRTKKRKEKLTISWCIVHCALEFVKLIADTGEC
jgi:hypothetical protein